MSLGQRIGDETTHAVRSVGHPFNSLRDNINSLADSLGDGVAGRSKGEHRSSTPSSEHHHHFGAHHLKDSLRTYHPPTPTGSNDISPDARRAAELATAASKKA